MSTGSGMSQPDDAQAQLLRAHIQRTLGNAIDRHPGGWRDEVEVALIDAIFSARANYGRPPDDGREATGVHRVLQEWRQLRDVDLADDLRALDDTIRQQGFEQLHTINAQQVPGPRPNRLTKWQAVHATAQQLLDHAIRHAADVRAHAATPDARRQLGSVVTATPGVGEQTLNYFLVLLGLPGVKADTMIRAFVDEALHPQRPIGSGEEHNTTPGNAARLVAATADAMGTDRSALDHAIWNHQREARRIYRRNTRSR